MGAATLAFAAAAQEAQAAGSSLAATGLHISAGALVDPNGRTWVSDHNAGFCRVSEPTDDGPGLIEHPDRPGQLSLRTCLGGLLPDAAPGPDAAGAPAFYDPSPEFANSGDEYAFIPDGASPSSEVVRAKWNRNTGLFEFDRLISMPADRGRPTVVSAGPDDNLYVAFQRETTIQRITAPASDAPIAEVVGQTADGRGALTLAAGRDATGATVVHVQESTGLRELRPNPVTQPVTTASTVDIPAADQVGIAAMTYDLATNVLWLGTADAAAPGDDGIDRLMRYDTRTRDYDRAYATGYTAVGGVALKTSDEVLVLDDPALIDPAEPLGVGRMSLVGRPAAHVTGPRHTNNTTPSFTLSGDAGMECRLTGGSLVGTWSACATTYTTPELLDGTYRLGVKAFGAGTNAGLVEVQEFTVDTVAPQAPTIVRPAEGGTVGTRPWFEFASEDQASFTCRFDAETEFTECAEGRIRTFAHADVQTHTVEVKAIDRAGNTSEASLRTTFTVDPSVESFETFQWEAGPPAYKGSSLYTEGLHISTGAIADPHGRIWVSDHNGGFCRVTRPTEDGPGTIEHPQLPTDTGETTCLGGLLPQAGTGPDAAGQAAYVDRTPTKPGNGDEIVLIPDGASPSSDVVRAQWNPDNGKFEYLDTVTLQGARVRPVAVALGPDGNAYVVGQRSGAIQRILDPAGSDPHVETVGVTSDGRGASAVAAGRDPEAMDRTVVYVAEAGGLRQLRPAAGRTPATAASFDIPGSVDATAPANIGSMVYDLERDHLYVGTADGVTAEDTGKDAVHRFSLNGASERRYLSGYSMIGGLGILPDGKLLVLDDPALLDPAEPLGTGRMFLVGLPSAHVVQGPLVGGVEAPNKEFVTSGTPEFVIQGEKIVQCRLVGASVTDSTWGDCGVDGRWVPSATLADGEYRLLVRSVDEVLPAVIDEVTGEVLQAAKTVEGLVEATKFTVDTIAPRKPVITSPNTATVGATPWFAFDSGEAGTTYRCSWNGAAFDTCVEGRTRTFTENGTHTLRIVSVDRAGNVSAESDPVTFRAEGRIEAVTITAGPEGSTTSRNARFEFTSNARDVQFGCRITGQAWSVCTSPKTYAGLADGTYTFEVRGMDAVGNMSPVVSRTFTVDNRAPGLLVTGIAEGVTVDGGSQVTITPNEQAAVSCAFDSTPQAACTGPLSLAGLADGTHTLNIVATDLAGNATPVRRVTFVIQRRVVQPTPVATEDVVLVAAPKPEPSVTVVDRTGRQVTIRIADIDRRVDLDRIREAGVTVQVVPARGAKLIRFRIFKVSGNGGRAIAAKKAQPKRKLVATVYRATKGGKSTVRIKPRELRNVTSGTYVLEVAAGTSRERLGVSVSRQFVVRR